MVEAHGQANPVRFFIPCLRWRKEGIGKRGYGGGVDVCHFPHAQTTVDEALASLPGALGVFQALQTGCVGCFLARFCSLTYVAQVYGLDLQDFLDKLRTSNQSFFKESVR